MTAFLYSDLLYFLWHGIKSCTKSLLVCRTVIKGRNLLQLTMADWPLNLRDKLLVIVGVICTKSNKFASGMRT